MTTEQRRALKARGGPEWEAQLAREKIARTRFKQRHPELVRSLRRENKRRQSLDRSFEHLKVWLCKGARKRGRKAGLPSTICKSDLVWPSHCPVLGIGLDYSDNRNPHHAARPSLDRWDNTKGYEPGNVFVISFRANTLKSNATWDELAAVSRYARVGVL